MIRDRFSFIGLGILASLMLLGIILFLISRLAGDFQTRTIPSKNVHHR